MSINNILNELFTTDISNHIFRLLIHPAAEIIKPLFCQTCHRRMNKCNRCDAAICIICHQCGSISDAMYCYECFEFYLKNITQTQYNSYT